VHLDGAGQRITCCSFICACIAGGWK
jgi:hypothetical protein